MPFLIDGSTAHQGFGEIKRQSKCFADFFNHNHGRRHYFGADAVARKNCEFKIFG